MSLIEQAWFVTCHGFIQNKEKDYILTLDHGVVNQTPSSLREGQKTRSSEYLCARYAC